MRFTSCGEMAEWSNAPVLKTGNGLSRSRVQIPISPPPIIEKPVKSKDLTGFLLFIVKIKVKVKV